MIRSHVQVVADPHTHRFVTPRLRRLFKLLPLMRS
jgi:hypothetical protein